MKRKFILLPITLTALAPAISLVGCNNPKPVYHEYEFKPWKNLDFITDELSLIENNYYKFWLNNYESRKEAHFGFLNNKETPTPLLVQVDNVKVLINGGEVPFEEIKTDEYWMLDFSTGKPPTNIEIYLRCTQTTENVYGTF